MFGSDGSHLIMAVVYVRNSRYGEVFVNIQILDVFVLGYVWSS
jgi:hypothetical protein